MKTLPSFTPQSIIKILIKKGFELDRTKGSHQIYIHKITGQRVIVPMHNKIYQRAHFFQV